MPGSRRIFAYTSDNNKRYLLEADESNYESVNSGANITASPTELETALYVPSGMIPRYGIYKTNDGETLKIIIATLALVETVPKTITVSVGGTDTQARLTFYRGESTNSNFNP